MFNFNKDKEEKEFKVSLKRAIISSIIDVVFFVIAPCVAILLIISNYPDLNPTEMDAMMYWSIVLGLSVALFSFFEAYFYPGHMGRLIAGICGTIMIMAWTYMVFGGTTIQSDYGGYAFFIDINRLILILIIGISLKALYRVVEYLYNKKYAQEIINSNAVS